MKHRRLMVVALLASMAIAPKITSRQAAAAGGGTRQEHLGKVNFPTSCSPTVQNEIEKGVALLHSFQYKEAHQTFETVLGSDPKCAMAHWGKAMSLYHQLWDFPDEKKMKEGYKEIADTKKLRQSTREQGFLAAAGAFYQKDKKLSHAQRKEAYAAQLEKFRQEVPNDVEIESFYALSLIALAEEPLDMMQNLQKAIHVLNPLFQQYPDHPGVAHYLIHATDKPDLAEQGLTAARRYAAIAPDSSHAIHMPSHIFVRLGLWQDSITSNIAANEAGAHAAEMHTAESHYQTHAMDYLSYSYLQSGQQAKAMEVIEHMDHVVGADHDRKAEGRAYLEARTRIELHQWKEAAGLRSTGPGKGDTDSTQWAVAIGAARSGNTAAAAKAVQELTSGVESREKRERKNGYNVPTGKATDLSEAEAWLAFAEGKTDQAVQELKDTAEREGKNGEESLVVPAREMLADMQMELKKPAEALANYQTVLKNAPNRFDALLGAGRAAQAVGDSSGALGFYAKLTEMCPEGADRRELTEAKAVVAKK